MIQYTIGEIAKELGAEAAGDLTLKVTGVQEPGSAGTDELALAIDPKFAENLTAGQALAAVLWQGADWQEMGLKAAIFAPKSRYVMAGITRVFERRAELAPGLHSTAIVDPTAHIGQDASIGAFCVIGARVVIGKNAQIHAHTSIGEDSVVGNRPLIYAGCRLGARLSIGDNVVFQPNAVIGADGFSYVTPKPGAIEEAKSTGQISSAGTSQGFVRINSLGSVRIGDDVEIGANACIDRGTIENTVIGRGTKLDNQVHLGHNVKVGEDCLLCGQVGVAGSTVIGDRVVLGGQVGVADHIRIGSDVIVAGASSISSHVPSGRVMMGNPAMRMDQNVDSYKAIRRLPRLMAKIADLEKAVSKLSEKQVSSVISRED